MADMKNQTLQQLERNEVISALHRVIDKVVQQDGSVSESEVEKYFAEAMAELGSEEPDQTVSEKLTQDDLPERLNHPAYGSEERKKRPATRARNTPPIEEIWKISQRLPSFTKLLLEGRE